MTDRQGPGRSRRSFLGLAGLAGVAGTSAAALGGCTADSSATSRSHASGSPGGRPSAPPLGASIDPSGSVPVDPTGTHQAGVVTPNPPQPNLLTVVYDLHGDVARAGAVIADLGRTVLALTGGRAPGLAGLDPADLTVTVGVGPRLVAAADRRAGRSTATPGAADLPAFPRERFDATGRGGDVVVQLCASDPLLLPGCAAAVATAHGGALRERWRQPAFRGGNVRITGDAYAPRNLLGFVDGIIGPRTAADDDADVWLSGPAHVAGGTIMVARRMEIDLDAFLTRSVTAQEAVIGRTRATAAPLTGGTIATDPDLGAKTPTGAYVIPADAHLRRANPSETGVPPMLRRSYSFSDSASGLLFVSFQNALSTFVDTLARMAEVDALFELTTTTRSATFLVLPGFDDTRALGAELFA